MAANIPGAESSAPAVISTVETIQRGVAVPSGSRIAVIIGEGVRSETVISNANGGGTDGIGADGTVTGVPNGRVFLLGSGAVVAPLITNRTKVYRTGQLLNLVEEAVDGSAFSALYDARVDIDTGILELQGSSLVDQGGNYYRSGSNNVGNGTVASLVLSDADAPAETWTIRCTSTRKDGYGDPIDGYARFIARGSVSGSLLDGYGNQIVWQSNGTSTTNGILTFLINEGATKFREGDSFVIQTEGGPLRKGEYLTAEYISETQINDPEFFTDNQALTSKHGPASAENTLSLGAQMHFANGSPGVYAIQAAPALPRRVSYVLVESATGQTDPEDCTFALPLGAQPDVDSNINFFLRNPVTRVETQVVPNKVDFYQSAYTSNPSSFITGETYAYTVVNQSAVMKEGFDGYITALTSTTARISSATIEFTNADTAAGMGFVIYNATTAGNDGTFTITGVTGGQLLISRTSGTFTSEASASFQVVDTAVTSARILVTEDLAPTINYRLRATVVDERDATFFDAGWINAFDAAETIEVDMVIPLPTQTKSSIFANAKAHVLTMSQAINKKERVLLIGGITGLTPDNVMGNSEAAVEDIGVLEGIQGDSVSEILAGTDEDLADYGVYNNYGDTFRVKYMYPDSCIVQAGSQNITVDGCFMAAAISGWYSGMGMICEPCTNKTIAGFSLPRSKKFSPTIVNNLSKNGITVVEPLSAGGRIVWDKTTTNSLQAEEEEQSIVFIRDRIAKDMRLGFSPFIGKALDDRGTIQSTLYARAIGMAQGFISRKLISDYRNIIIKEDSIEPRQWNVSIEVRPVYPINWIWTRVFIGNISSST